MKCVVFFLIFFNFYFTEINFLFMQVTELSLSLNAGQGPRTVPRERREGGGGCSGCSGGGSRRGPDQEIRKRSRSSHWSKERIKELKIQDERGVN